MRGQLTRASIRLLDWLAKSWLRPPRQDARQRTGVSGEEEAYFFLRRQGYVMVARNFRDHRHKGEIDLVGWDGDTLCFIEVKTRSSRAVKPAEAAVDAAKRRNVRLVAEAYLRRVAGSAAWRFDVVSVYLEAGTTPDITLFKNALAVS